MSDFSFIIYAITFYLYVCGYILVLVHIKSVQDQTTYIKYQKDLRIFLIWWLIPIAIVIDGDLDL